MLYIHLLFFPAFILILTGYGNNAFTFRVYSLILFLIFPPYCWLLLSWRLYRDFLPGIRLCFIYAVITTLLSFIVFTGYSEFMRNSGYKLAESSNYVLWFCVPVSVLQKHIRMKHLS